MFRKIGATLGILIAASILVAAFASLVRRPVSEERLRELGVIEPDSQFIEVDGVRTRYVMKGDGDETIIFIHGFASSLFTWRKCLGPLSREFRAVALDLKGFGFSDKPETGYTIGEYADFLIHFMDALQIETATLCGNSMGGNIAWRSALEYPERVNKLILVDASGYPSEHSGIPFFLKLARLPGVGEALSAVVTRGRIRSSLESAYSDETEVPPSAVDAYYYPMRTNGAMNAVLARLRGFSDEEKAADLRIPELDLPTLIIWGAEDTWVEVENAHRFHRDIRNSNLHIIPECGHLPQEEKPIEFTVAVLGFMSAREREEILIRESLPRHDRARSLTM